MLPDDVMATVNQYCARLGKALHKVPSSERDEIVEEVRSHILERLEAETEVSQRTVSEILRAVGDPRELASEYRTQAMLRHAVHSRSPWVLLRATLAWASRGVAGLVAFFATVAGYGCTAVFFLCVLLNRSSLPVSGFGWDRSTRSASAIGTAASWGRRSMESQCAPPFRSYSSARSGRMNGPVHELLAPGSCPPALFAAPCFSSSPRFSCDGGSRSLSGQPGRSAQPRSTNLSRCGREMACNEGYNEILNQGERQTSRPL